MKFKDTRKHQPKKLLIAALAIFFLAAGSVQALAQRGSLSLDGDGDYATTAHEAALDISGESISLEAWVKHDGNSETDAFIINKATTSYGYRLSLVGEGDETY
ncbi:MAG: hypothetical protein WD597_05255, partial [Balneolaceae bacterium]